MKKILVLFVLLSSAAFSQNIDNYEYVIIPLKFADFKEPNKYNLNTNTKLLLQKYGFKAYLASDSIPNAIENASCRKLYADIVKDNTVLTTKIKVVIKDCKDNVVYETAFGKSKEKDLNRAYNEALRETGKSFDKLNYKYNGKNEIAMDQPQQKTKAIAQYVGDSASDVDVVKVDSELNTNPETFFFAQPIANGFQIVNSEPKVIMKLFSTSVKNVFIASKEAKTGVVLSKNNQWFFEYYENSKLVSESLNLKF